MHDIYKQKCLVKSIYLVLQIKHCKKVRSSIGFKAIPRMKLIICELFHNSHVNLEV